MTFEASRPATLVDLLDRVLERGLVIDADIIITLSGIPLIGLNLRAALAGMDTMQKYGIMAEWDRETRAGAMRSEPSRPIATACTSSVQWPGRTL